MDDVVTFGLDAYFTYPTLLEAGASGVGQGPPARWVQGLDFALAYESGGCAGCRVVIGGAAAVSAVDGQGYCLVCRLFVLDDVWNATDEANVIPMIISGVSWLNEDELGMEGLFAERLEERKC